MKFLNMVRPVYILNDHLDYSKATRAYSIDNARKKAIDFLDNHSARDSIRIYKAGMQGYVGDVKRTVASDTRYCWRVKRLDKWGYIQETHDLYKSGKLGKKWKV